MHATPTLEQLKRGTQTIIGRQVTMRQSFYDRNNVPIYRGEASFVDEHSVSIDGDDPIRAKYFVIATGSRPYRPSAVDFSHPRIFDSDTVLGMDHRPSSMSIYGAGVIGVEYASMFRNLGIKINLINTRSKLLEFLDDEIIDALSYHLRDQGVIIRHNESMERIEGDDDGVIVHLKSGKQVKTDVLLWANGRSGNTEDLGLENVNLTPNSRGQVDVDEHFQTTIPHIYAVGDVIGPPALASAAYTQGRAAAMHLMGEADGNLRVHDIPTGIYTSPEISSVGKTERDLTAACVPYEVGQAQFKSSGASSDHRPNRRHAEASVPSRNAGDPRGALLRCQRLGDHPHRTSDHESAGRSQFDELLHRDDVQLPNDGRGLPSRRPERDESAVLAETSIRYRRSVSPRQTFR